MCFPQYMQKPPLLPSLARPPCSHIVESPVRLVFISDPGYWRCLSPPAVSTWNRGPEDLAFLSCPFSCGCHTPRPQLGYLSPRTPACQHLRGTPPLCCISCFIPHLGCFCYHSFISPTTLLISRFFIDSQEDDPAPSVACLTGSPNGILGRSASPYKYTFLIHHGDIPYGHAHHRLVIS